MKHTAMTVTLMTIIVMMIMKINAAQVFIKSVHRGEAVQLTTDLQELGIEHIQDIIWSHLHLYIKKNKTTGCGGRCELLDDGSLSFKGVESVDEGNYTQEVFGSNGKLLKKAYFTLRVETVHSTDDSRVWVRISLSSVFLLLILLIVIPYFIHRRRSQRRAAADQTQGNIYMEMRSCNKIPEEIEGQQVEKVKPSKPIGPQTPEEENVYV